MSRTFFADGGETAVSQCLTNLISNWHPTASAYFRHVAMDGECFLLPPPASSLAMADVFVPMRSATSA